MGWFAQASSVKINYVSVLIFLFILSCNFASKKFDEKKNDADSINNQSGLGIKSATLLGTWRIYSRITNNSNINCNSCPKIRFDHNDNAVLILPSGDESKLKWTANSSKLSITYQDKHDNGNTFSDSNYSMRLVKEKEFMELNLNQPKKNYSIILRRENN